MSNLAERIANEIAAERAMHEMCRAMNDAGYVAFADEFQAARELEDRWVFVAVDEEGDFTVGAFFKDTGEFATTPIATTKTERFALTLLDAQE